MTGTSFDYSNLSGRPNGRVVTLASVLLKGVRTVQAQIEPYARDWQRHNHEAVAADGPLWVVIGDSMAQGIGASAYDRGWVGQLAETLPDHRLVNLSVYGARIGDVLESQLPAMESIGVEPDLVTVIVGSNDMISPKLRPALPEALAEMLRRLPAGTVIGNQPGGREAVIGFNRQIDDAAAEGRVTLAEYRDPRTRSWKGKLSADHFHPNDLGYTGMAEIMAEAIDRS